MVLVDELFKYHFDYEGELCNKKHKFIKYIDQILQLDV